MYRAVRAAVAACTVVAPLLSQAPRSGGRRPERVVVTATRMAEDPFEVPFATTILDGDFIRHRLQARTTPESLRFVPGISVQKTAHGQGSPKFRGQTGFQTLLLVDGIRINDSTWRSGNVEYWNHLDALSFERFEILRGPASVMWGSDAVAGVGHAVQKGRHSFEPGLHADGAALVRYASAEQSLVTRLETQGNYGERLGWHVGFSFKNFGDLRAGRDVGLLPDTGYEDRDGDAKVTLRLDEHHTLSLGAQQNHLRNVPRTHSTVRAVSWRGLTAGSDLKREQDHRRQLYWLQWGIEDGSFFDEGKVTLAYKNRYEREDRIRSNGRRRFNVLTVQTAVLTAQFSRELGLGRLVFGGDWYHDFVDSEFREFNADGTLRTTRNRGVVAGDADYDLGGLFAQYEVPVQETLSVLAGLRWTLARLDASDVDVPGDSVVFDDVSETWNAVTGSLRAIWAPRDDVRIFGGFTQGFRAPNLSDTTRFDVARSGELEVPAQGLDPEFYYTFELGSRYDDGTLSGQITGWYTIARDQISRFRTGKIVNGQPEVSKGNIGDGWYAGFELEGSLGLDLLCGSLANFAVFGFFDYVDGRIDQVLASGQEVRDRPKAMPPPSGLLGLRYLHPSGKGGAEAYVRMAYHVRPSRFTEADRNNTQRVPPDGLPGWAVFGLRTWADVHERVTLALAVENLTDLDYRIMDSGLQEPGANVILSVEARL